MDNYQDNIIVDPKGDVFIRHYSKSFSKFSTEALSIGLFVAGRATLENEIDKSKADKVLNLLIGQFDAGTFHGRKVIEVFSKTNSQDIFGMKAYEKILAQMILSRIADNFLSYLKEILSEVLIIKPEILKSKDTEKLEFVLSFDNIDDLRVAIAEKKIEELSYRSFSDMVDFFENKLGIIPFIENDFHFLKTKILERNLIVHNRGIINRQFIKQLELDESLLGKEVSYNIVQAIDIYRRFSNQVSIIDSKITSKFKIPVIDGGPIK